MCYCLSTDVPGPPGAPDVSEIFADSCKLSWAAPAKDGGAPIQQYIIERRTGVHWIALKKTSKTTEFVVRELNEKQKYEFRILAENKIGVGKPSGPSDTVLAKNPFSK